MRIIVQAIHQVKTLIDYLRKKVWAVLETMLRLFSEYKGTILRVIIEVILISLAVSAFTEIAIIPRLRATFAPKPDMEVIVVENVGMKSGAWFRQLYWREGYHAYDITVINKGNAPATEVRFDIEVPGGIFAVDAAPHIGLQAEASPVAVRFGSELQVVDPVSLGRLLGWQPLGDFFEVVQGDPVVSVSLGLFPENLEWRMTIYFKERGDVGVAKTGQPIRGTYYWTSEVTKAKGVISEVKSMPYTYSFTPWQLNPYKFPENGDPGVPYAHADLVLSWGNACAQPQSYDGA